MSVGRARKSCHHTSSRCFLTVLLTILFAAGPSLGAESADPESVLRTLVKANADKDLETMARHMSQEADAIGYSIGGRKYVGWQSFADEMRSEFSSVTRLEIPILDLRTWRNQDVAWFAMELDYIRHIAVETGTQRMVFHLRETGVMERRNGRWILVSWHESPRDESLLGVPRTTSSHLPLRTSDASQARDSAPSYDLSGEWEVLEPEENKTYRATLDRQGNGPYTWQGGHFTTTSFKDRRWHGRWKQTGNDREGGFELVLSEDGTEARGIWWYQRVGNRDNIPARQHGGNYVWKRLTPPPSTQQ